ncbi:hypothetical protein FD06_GL000717 [Apilactobacillus ozensis DSM 23829 = JCM 17196]|uniref:Uncharacterized protein n=1 Tax=Apilactobacillus ozensis DSM 23829 = JCM 17196 TaxID=1423781 RepID=A0A0R2AJZ2_9LACO|nr:hypothetical protein FD06_GL000717 [Apilactobacillus ozensis DSM 23829 = JCM 17196]
MAVAIIEGLFYIGCLIVLFQILNYFHVWIYLLEFCVGAFMPLAVWIWIKTSDK